MKKVILFCSAMLLFEGSSFAQTKHVQKTASSHIVSAEQLATERTEKDTKLYGFTPEQKKKAYSVNLEISRQLVGAKDQMKDKNLLRITEQERFEKYRTFFSGNQMRKLVEERDRIMKGLD